MNSGTLTAPFTARSLNSSGRRTSSTIAPWRTRIEAWPGVTQSTTGGFITSVKSLLDRRISLPAVFITTVALRVELVSNASSPNVSPRTRYATTASPASVCFDTAQVPSLIT